MEVKPGYKQTEAGIIPEEWEAPQIRSICRLINGRGFKPYEWQTTGLPIIRIQNLNGSEDFNYYSGQFNPKILVEPGQLLFAWSGSRGTSFGPHIWSGGRALLNYHTWKVAVDESAINTRFLFHALRHLTADIEDKAHGASALVHTQKGEMEQFQIPIPPTESEQHAIAEALSDVDRLLGGLDQLIAKKRDLKQAAMYQLLTGRTRLPGVHGEWEVKSVGEIANISKGTQLHSSETDPNGHFPHFNGGISPSSFTHKFNTPANTIAISEGGNSCGYVQLVSQPFWCGGHCYAVVPKSADSRFLFHALKGQQPAIHGLRVGSGLPNVQKTALAAFKIRLPAEHPEQTAIADVLTEMDTELAALEQRREKTRALKQAMMQELLTGRIRLVAHSSNATVLPLDSASPAQPRHQKPAHSWAFNEAVVIAVIAAEFGTVQFPLGRMRYTKLAYLLHRHSEHAAQGYLKKAAGPYNPATRYAGPEKIACESDYIKRHKRDQFEGFIAGEKNAQARGYFLEWYGQAALDWLQQFRFWKKDELERVATVDMAMEELRRANLEATVDSVKEIIASSPDWLPKLDRAVFADVHLDTAIKQCRSLFPIC